MNTRTYWIGGILIAVVLFIAFGETASRSLFGGWSFTESATFDRGTYFRLMVKLDYKGEPQDFDIVVGCNVLDIDYKDGSNTHEVGLVPTVYGRRMSDGKGLVIRPPDACDGETTANGKVPRDFMPLIIVYDDADTLGFGTAYLSDEAYASPLSVLKFGNATIEPATRGEFDDFRKNGAPNLVSRSSYHSAGNPDQTLAKMGLSRTTPALGRLCVFYRRFAIPEEARAQVRKYWPPDRPQYWTPPKFAEQREAVRPMYELPLRRDIGQEAHPISEYPGGEFMADYGVTRNGGAGALRMPNGGHPDAPSYYPATTDVLGEQWPRNRNDWLNFISSKTEITITDIRVENGAGRGFAYCYLDPGFPPGSAEYNAITKIPGKSLVDGVTIMGGPKFWNYGDVVKRFFERDEYFFVYGYLYLESTRGDV